MQGELRGTNTDLNIEILGVNQSADSAYNYLAMATAPTLPWLQDTAEQNAATRWQARYRDVRILNGQNEVVSIYNLTDYDLSIPTQYNALKRLFIAAAKAVDSDKDALPDDWEMRWFRDLSARPDQDADADGSDNLTEFAFGTNPVDPNDGVPIVAKRASTGAPAAVSFRRRAGSMLEYQVETSTDLTQWLPATNTAALSLPRNLFDGTGTSEVTFQPGTDSLARRGFLRIRIVPRWQAP
jgi:hypothetical protein